MVRAEILWPFVEKVLLEEIGGEHFSKVDDHVVLLRAGSSKVIIRMQDDDPARLQVFSPLLHGVEKSPALLERLNELDAGLAFVKVFWVEGDVLAATELLGEGLDTESIVAAINTVSATADALDDDLRTAFGGEKAFPDDAPLPDTTDVVLERFSMVGGSEGVGAPPGEEVGAVPAVATGRRPAGEPGPADAGAGAEAEADDPRPEDPPGSAGYL